MSKWNPNFLEALWQQATATNLSSGTVKLACLTGYTPSDAHDAFDDISAAVVGTPVTLTGKSFDDGIFHATVPSYDGAELNEQDISAMYIYIDTGTPSTSRLVYVIDSEEPQIPFTGLGADQPIALSEMPLCDQDGVGDYIYPAFAQALFQQPSDSSVASGTVRCIGYNEDFDPDDAEYVFLDELMGDHLTGGPQTLGSKSYTSGIFGAASIAFGDGVTDLRGLLFYIDTTDPETSRLIGIKRNIQALPSGGLTTVQPLPVSFTGGVFTLGAEYSAP